MIAITASNSPLARRANVNAREPSHDQTALMWAAAQKHPQVVQALVERGADVRARTRVYQQTVTSEVTQRAGREELNYSVPRGGSTPLLFAARVGDAESVRILIEAGADVNDALPDGTSAYETSGYRSAAAFWRVTRPAVSCAAVDAGSSVAAAACARKRTPSTTEAT